MQELAARILVVEDDQTLGSALVSMLAEVGHEVRWAKTGADARRLIAEAPPDLVMLDLGLPDTDGIELCAHIRSAHAELPIVVVTARTDEADAVRALDGGADDYITKPYRPAELQARLRSQLRRREALPGPDLAVGHIRLQQLSRRAWVGQVEVPLRPKEFELLVVLMRSAGEAVRREHLMDQVWDEHWSGSTKTLDVHVGNVRRKLADAGDRWDRIVTLRGFAS